MSVKRCAAGRSTPTARSTLAGKFAAPYTRMVVSVNCTTEAWKWVASARSPAPVAGVTLESVEHRIGGAWASGRGRRPARRVSCQSVPAAGEHRRRDRRSARRRKSGRLVHRGRGSGPVSRPRTASRSGASRGPSAGCVVQDGAQIGRLAGARSVPTTRALQAQRAQRVEHGRPTAPRCAVDRRAPRWSPWPPALRTPRGASADRAGAGSAAHDSSGLRWLPSTPALAISGGAGDRGCPVSVVGAGLRRPPQAVNRVSEAADTRGGQALARQWGTARGRGYQQALASQPVRHRSLHAE